MTVVLLACQFNYYLITFNIKYLPGNIFMNQIISGVSEISFFITSLSLYRKLGLKRSMVLGFSFSILGAIPLIFVSNGSEAVPAMILLAKSGTAYILNICYLAFSLLFPPIFSQTAFGISKLIARIATIFSPLVAEIGAPIPMIIVTILAIVGGSASCFIIHKGGGKKKRREVSFIQ